MDRINLEISIGSIKFKNPIFTAAGPVGFGSSFADFFPLDILGGLVSRSLTYEARLGNKPPRLWETPSGMMNNIGFQNPGLEAFTRNFYPSLKELDTNLIISIYGNQIEEYKMAASGISSLPKVNALEVNTYLDYEQYRKLKPSGYLRRVGQITRAVKQTTHLPVWIKLMPDTGNLEEAAGLAESEGADAVVVANTFRGMALDTQTGKSRLGSGTGGLSGAAIKPLALLRVWEVSRAVSIPVIGAGGIVTPSDAVEFMLAGARAVEIGSGNFVDPCTIPNIIDGIKEYLSAHGIMDIKDLTGTAKVSAKRHK